MLLADRSFGIALLLSVICHSLLFCRLPNLSMFATRAQAEAPEINYYQIKRKPITIRKQKQSLVKGPSVRPEETSIGKTQLIEKESIIEKEKITKIKGKAPIFKKEPLAHKKISVPALSSSVPEGAAYIDYYQAIRERIREAIDYPNQLVEGEVYVRFIVLSDGRLKELKILDRRSSYNIYLKEAATSGIKRTCPFPPFPKGLDQPQMSFNLIISFELR